MKIEIASPNDKELFKMVLKPLAREDLLHAGDHSARCRGLCAGFERSRDAVAGRPNDRLSEETKAPIFFPESERGFVTTAIRSGLGRRLGDVSGGRQNG